MQRSSRDVGTETRRATALSRRQLVGAIGAGALPTIAGCIGGGDDSDEQGDGDNSNDGSDEPDEGGGSESETTVAALCQQIPGELVGYDAGATPLVCDCDIPNTMAESFGPTATDRAHRGIIRSEVSQYGELTVNIQQQVEERLVGEEPFDRGNQPEELETEFGGETIQFYGQPSAANPSTDTSQFVKLDGSLPYSVNGTKLYFPVSVVGELDVAEDIPDDCRETVTATTRQVTQRLRPNEETTIAQTISEQWDNPP